MSNDNEARVPAGQSGGGQWTVGLTQNGQHVRSSVFNAKSEEEAKETAKGAWRVPSHEIKPGGYQITAKKIGA